MTTRENYARSVLRDVPQRMMWLELLRRLVKFFAWFYFVTPEVFAGDTGPDYQETSSFIWCIGLIGALSLLGSLVYFLIASEINIRFFILLGFGVFFYLLGGVFCVYALRRFGFRL